MEKFKKGEMANVPTDYAGTIQNFRTADPFQTVANKECIRLYILLLDKSEDKNADGYQHQHKHKDKIMVFLQQK